MEYDKIKDEAFSLMQLRVKLLKKGDKYKTYADGLVTGLKLVDAITFNESFRLFAYLVGEFERAYK